MSALHVELLTYARDRYAEKRRNGLCRYLNEGAEKLGLTFEASQIKHHIKELLDGNAYLEDWIYEAHDVPYSELLANGTDKDPERAVATRIAWADWLIEEWRDAP